jgi:hypothetical protein
MLVWYLKFSYGRSRSKTNSVGITAGWGLENQDSIPGKGIVETSSGSPPTKYGLDNGTLFQEIKLPEHEAYSVLEPTSRIVNRACSPP